MKNGATIPAMIPALLALLLFQAPAPQSSFAALEVYNGHWTVQAQHSFSGGSGPDALTNTCHADAAFFTCEQVVNGRPGALVVFTPAKTAGEFKVANVMPDGSTSTGTTLTVTGNHWTFLSRDPAGKPSFRVENSFLTPDHIHFEMSSTADGGVTWTPVNQGDTTRAK